MNKIKVAFVQRFPILIKRKAIHDFVHMCVLDFCVRPIVYAIASSMSDALCAVDCRSHQSRDSIFRLWQERESGSFLLF